MGFLQRPGSGGNENPVVAEGKEDVKEDKKVAPKGGVKEAGDDKINEDVSDETKENDETNSEATERGVKEAEDVDDKAVGGEKGLKAENL